MLMQETNDFPSPSVLRKATQSNLKTPIVFKNALKTLKSWENIPWTIEQLSIQHGRTSLNFRVVPKVYNSIAWEGNADYVEATIDQFIEWQNRKQSSDENLNPFHSFNPDHFWAYSSYNYLSHTFHEDSPALKTVDWSAFGYPNTCGNSSAFWIGSEESYTPCHFDTYGFNLVAQIQGSKKWTLFPPEDTSFLYPTRIPYEESSVFSSVNILDPNLKTHPLFKCCHPHVIILEPGDVLFVPNKWWHFVQSLTMSVSINTWLQLDCDGDSRLEEGVTRTLMSSFISYLEPDGESWLNPKEELVSPEETIKYITLLLNKIKCSESVVSCADDFVSTSSTSSVTKGIKNVHNSDIHSDNSVSQLAILLSYPNIKPVTAEPFFEWYGKPISSESEEYLSDMNMKNIIDCFVHPDVVSVICKLLKNL